MADFDPDRFQASFNRLNTHKDRMRFEGRLDLVEDLAIILEVVYAGFVQSQALTTALNDIKQEVHTMAGELDTLTKQVASSITIQDSAIQLLQGLKASLDAAIAALNSGDNGAALLTLSQNLATEQGKMAAAIAANTPVVTPPIQTPLQLATARGDTMVSQTDTQITLQAADSTQTTYDKTTGAVVVPTPTPAPVPTPPVPPAPPTPTPTA